MNQPHLARRRGQAGRDHVVSTGSAGAIVLCHDVLGRTDAVADLAARLSTATGLTVYAPHLLDDAPLPRDSEQVAYQRFMATLGIDGLTERLRHYVSRLISGRVGRPNHDSVYCLGLSVGATATWLATAGGELSAAIAVYGSRIRDFTDHRPDCPTHVVFAAHEPSFDPGAIVDQLRSGRVTVEILPYAHGFCSIDSPAYSTVGLSRVLACAETVFTNPVKQRGARGDGGSEGLA